MFGLKTLRKQQTARLFILAYKRSVHVSVVSRSLYLVLVRFSPKLLLFQKWVNAVFSRLRISSKSRKEQFLLIQESGKKVFNPVLLRTYLGMESESVAFPFLLLLWETDHTVKEHLLQDLFPFVTFLPSLKVILLINWLVNEKWYFQVICLVTQASKLLHFGVSLKAFHHLVINKCYNSLLKCPQNGVKSKHKAIQSNAIPGQGVKHRGLT